MASKRLVNPNRMELLRLKRQLLTARRGHKLLKDKRDELMRQFLDIIRENKRLREEVEAKFRVANEQMVLARAVMSPETLRSALMAGHETMTCRRVMTVVMPDAYR